MAIADTITSMQTHTSNAYTMIGYGTDLTGINKNLENLSTSIFNAFLEALRTPDTLFTNLPKKSGSGSVISLNDTANAPMRITLGASELTQDATPTPSSPQAVHTISGSNKVVVCGKNLLDEDTLRNATYNTNTYKNTQTNIIGNQTLYFKASLKEGKTAISGLYLGLSTTPNPNTGDYTMPIVNGAIASTFTAKTFNSNSKLYLAYYPASKSITDIFDTYNLWVSTSDIPYEPYISQEAEVNLSSKNLAYTGWASNFISRVNDSTKARLEEKDNKLCLLYTASVGYGDYDNKYIFKTNWKANTQYTISFDVFATASTGSINMGIEYTDGTISNLFTTYNGWEHKVITSTANKTIKYIRGYYSTGNAYIDLDTFMINEGTQELPYVPYYTPIEYCKIGNYEDKFIRTSGKNLISSDDYMQGTFSPSTGGNNNVSSSTTTKVSTKLIDIEMCSNLIYSGNYFELIAFYTKDLSYISYTSDNPSSVPTNAKYCRIRLNNNNNEILVSTIQAQNNQLENGTVATDYEPYGSNEWYIKKNTGKVVLDGTESWSDFGTGNNNFRCQYDVALPNILTPPTNPAQLFSNYFKATTRDIVYDMTGVGIAQYGLALGKIFICAPLSILNEQTLNGFKTWLSTHNTKVYYPLATSTYTQITGTLANQLENVYQKLLSYSGTTNISQVNNDLSFNMSVQAIEGSNV